MMVCLDTDILVGALRNDADAHKKIAAYVECGIELSTTPISACELYNGAFRSQRREENMDSVSNLLENMTLLDFNHACAQKSGELAVNLAANGTPIGVNDTYIAAIAASHQQILVTRNTKHFKHIPELRIENW